MKTLTFGGTFDAHNHFHHAFVPLIPVRPDKYRQNIPQQILPEAITSTHTSLNAQTLVTSPIRQRSPFCMTSRLQHKEQHINKGLVPTGAAMISTLRKYLAQKREATNESGDSIILHSFFTSKTLLKRMSLLNPNLPSTLG